MILFCSFQVGQQECFHIGWHSDSSDYVRPKGDWRRGNQLFRECDDLKIVVEVLATAAILREGLDKKFSRSTTDLPVGQKA